MMEMMRNKKKKGFTLVELIVVIAIIGILAAIAIPKFSEMRGSAQVKAEAATAAQIVNAARIQETENDGVAVKALTQTDTAANGDLQKSYMTIPSGVTYSIKDGADKPYVVTWTSKATNYAGDKTYTEGTKFAPK